jgi:DNA-binding transcriptional ArsR family regulator
MLEKFFDELDSLISSNANFATIRNKLQTLREQAEAVEMENQTLNSEAHADKRRIEELEKQVGDPDKVDGTGFKFLRLLFDKACPLSIEDIAPHLGLSKPEAEYHRDVLLKKNNLEERRRLLRLLRLLRFWRMAFLLRPLRFDRKRPSVRC